MQLTEEDILNIEKAKNSGEDIWKSPFVSDIKNRIKIYFRKIENEQCCYCKKNFQGEFKMVIDIEHILPKGHPKFKKFMFTLSNLNIACKRCNMNIKGKKTDFLFSIDNAATNHIDPANYKFIHPNVDDYFKHIKVHQLVENDSKLIKYQIISNSSKGKYTYEYFRLKELEIDTINQEQGIIKKTEFSDKIDVEIQEKLRKILNKV